MRFADERRDGLSSGLTQACAVLAAGFGVAALVGWIADIPVLTNFGSGQVPMAPSTAVLFVLFGTMIFFHARTPQSGKTQRTGITLGSLGVIVSLLLFFLSARGIHLEAEHLGLRIAGMVGGAPIGHISPVTAFCFVFAGTSFLASLLSLGRRWQAVAAYWLASIAVLASAALLLAYALGSPFLYHGDVIPPALPTSLALAILGTGLLVWSGQRARPRDKVPEAAGVPSRHVLILVFMLSATGIVVVGHLYFQRYEERFRAEAQRQISTIADMKVSELLQWRKERLGNAAVFLDNENLSGLVWRFLEQPGDADARGRLRTWLARVQAAYQYDRASLLDAQGVERASTADASGPAASYLATDVSEVLRSGRMVFVDFYRDAADGRICLAVLAPILDATDHGRALGVLALRIDPERYLYPMIKRWPAPSDTAETLLVRRDKDDALFLNNLRFDDSAALRLRIPLDRLEVPEVMAIRGTEGIVEGIDYRGKRVVAALDVIPDSPWFLIARMDTSEMYAPLRERLWMMVGLVGVLLFGGGAAMAALWQANTKAHYRDLARAQEALARSEETLRTVFESARDGIVAADLETRKFVVANEAICRMLGYGRDEVLALAVGDIHAAEELPRLADLLERQARGESALASDVPLRRKDGSVFYADVNATAVNLTGRPCLIGVFRDVTERRRTQEELRARGEELAALYGLSTRLRKAENQAELLPMVLGEARRILQADSAGTLLLSSDATVLTVALADGHWEANSGRTLPADQGLAGPVLGTGKPYVTDDYGADPAALPIEHSAETGPAVFVPLRSEAEQMGLLAVARHRRPDAAPFSATDVRLFTMIGEMVGNALRRMHLMEAAVSRLKRLQALREIDMAITGSLDVRVTLNVLLDEVTSQLGTDAASILLFNPFAQTLEYAAGRGFRGHAIEKSRLRIGEGHAGRAAAERRVVSSREPGDWDERFKSALGSGAEGFATYIAAPMIAKGQVVGVLETFLRRAIEPDREWVEFLEALAGQAAVAVENARLFSDLERSNRELLLAYDETIEGWSMAMDFRDKETEGHTRRVSEMTVRLAKAMGVGGAEIVHIKRGALLHDMGKLGVPDSILLKPGKLTDEEWKVMKMHSQYAYEILMPISYLRLALDIPFSHHEKWDGTGYPLGLKGRQIPLAARIFAVVDVWDALLSERPYRPAWPAEKTFEHIKQQSGTHFDPEAVEAFLRETGGV